MTELAELARAPRLGESYSSNAPVLATIANGGVVVKFSSSACVAAPCAIIISDQIRTDRYTEPSHRHDHIEEWFICAGKRSHGFKEAALCRGHELSRELAKRGVFDGVN